MDSDGRATDEEKNLLRRSIVRKATIEETDWWINQNLKFLSEKARTVFHDMSDEDKFRVMSEGPLSECRDVVEILYGRVKRFMEMEAKLRSMANSGTRAVEKPKEKQVSQVAQQIAQQMAMPILEEVPESERRLGTVGAVNAAKESKEKVLIGTKKQGVGGVIEALQKKYNMQKGQRAKVIAETKELWKMEGELNVPKVHMNKGWKWVLQGGDEAAKKKAEDQARKKAEKEAHEKTKKEDKQKKEERQTQDEADKKTKTVKEKKVKKSRERKRSSESRSPSSSPKRKTKSKSKSKHKRETSSEKDSGSGSVELRKKRKARRSSSSDSDWKRLYRK